MPTYSAPQPCSWFPWGRVLPPVGWMFDFYCAMSGGQRDLGNQPNHTLRTVHMPYGIGAWLCSAMQCGTLPDLGARIAQSGGRMVNMRIPTSVGKWNFWLYRALFHPDDGFDRGAGLC